MFFTTAIVVGQGAVTTMGGFGFARLRFPAKNVLFLAYLGTMMIPFQVLLVPLFALMYRTRLSRTA